MADPAEPLILKLYYLYFIKKQPELICSCYIKDMLMLHELQSVLCTMPLKMSKRKRKQLDINLKIFKESFQNQIACKQVVSVK